MAAVVNSLLLRHSVSENVQVLVPMDPNKPRYLIVLEKFISGPNIMMKTHIS